MPPIAVFTNEGDPALARNRAAQICANHSRIYDNVKIHLISVEFNPR